MHYNKLHNVISNYINLYPEDFEIIKCYFNYISVEKGVTLIETGKHTEKVFFILSGYLKYSKETDSGEDLIIHLYSPDNFAISLNSFFLGVKSEEALQTITQCELLHISKTDLEELYSIDHKWNILVRKLLESALIEKEERIIDQLSLTAQDKYAKLLQKHPDIILNVPVKYIASFIGIQPESLSRIRKIN